MTEKELFPQKANILTPRANGDDPNGYANARSDLLVASGANDGNNNKGAPDAVDMLQKSPRGVQQAATISLGVSAMDVAVPASVAHSVEGTFEAEEMSGMPPSPKPKEEAPALNVVSGATTAAYEDARGGDGTPTDHSTADEVMERSGVSARFVVTLSKAAGSKLGITARACPSCRGHSVVHLLHVTAIKDGGLLDMWNQQNTGSAVVVGDCVAQVNDVAGDWRKMLDTLSDAAVHELKLHIVRLAPVFRCTLRRPASDNSSPLVLWGLKFKKTDCTITELNSGVALSWNEGCHNDRKPELMIRIGDRIAEVNGVKSGDPAALAVELKKPGTTVQVSLVRRPSPSVA